MTHNLTAKREQRPAAGNTLELVKAPVLERERPAHDGAEHRARHEHLTGTGEIGYTRGDVDGHAAEVLADQLTLARVHSHADLHSELARLACDRQCAAQRARRRAIEGSQEPVAHRLDLTPAEAGQLLSHLLVVSGEQIAPAAITDGGGARRGIDDVG